LREISQELALLGLWRTRFFEHAAFYGGTALRILHGLDRFSEDLDFSLLTPSPTFDFLRFMGGLTDELEAFGFTVTVVKKAKSQVSSIESAFLKMETRKHLLAIGAGEPLLRGWPPGRMLQVKLEVDTNPPGGFETETRFLLLPIPFSVRVFSLPDLFAGKMHAVLCRRWKNRVKGRDWYDLVWYAARHPRIHLSHLEKRMAQSGHWDPDRPMKEADFRREARRAVDLLDVRQAREEVAPFVKEPRALEVWSKPFFHDVMARIVCV
jgi:hypothetical protein